jgi:hypothetical protein
VADLAKRFQRLAALPRDDFIVHVNLRMEAPPQVARVCRKNMSPRIRALEGSGRFHLCSHRR